MISCDIIDLTSSPISSGVPSLLSGSLFFNLFISLFKALILSVSIGPGAIFIVVIFYFAYVSVKDLRSDQNPTLKLFDIINLGFISLIWKEETKKI